MPELQVAKPWTCVLGVSLGLIGIDLELSILEGVAVLREKLVGGSQARLHAVLNHLAGTWRAGQFLDLKT